MPTTTAKLPTTAANVDNGGSAWATPNNALTDDGTYTNASTDGASTDYLVLNGVDFSEIPSDALILGISVETDIKCWNDTSTGTQTYYVALTDDGSTVDTTNKKTDTFTVTAANAGGTTAKITTFGSTTDLWGKSLLGKDINDSSTFGVVIYAPAGPATEKDVVAADYASISITWAPSAGMIGDI